MQFDINSYFVGKGEAFHCLMCSYNLLFTRILFESFVYNLDGRIYGKTIQRAFILCSISQPVSLEPAGPLSYYSYPLSPLPPSREECSHNLYNRQEEALCWAFTTRNIDNKDPIMCIVQKPMFPDGFFLPFSLFENISL